MREYALVYQRSDDSYSVIFRDDTDPADMWWQYPGAAELTEDVAKGLVKGLRAD
jgi:hypothetical protein